EVEIVNPQANSQIEINKTNPIKYVVKQNGMAILKSIQFSVYEYITNPSPECSKVVEVNSDNYIYTKKLTEIKKCTLKLVEEKVANVTREDFKDKLGGEINWFVDGARYKVGKQYYLRVGLELSYRNKGIWDTLLNEYVNGPLLASGVPGTDETSGVKHRRKLNYSNTKRRR
ncbi:11821_t:CDS:2, partial [Funneliformis mosseae]